MCPTARQLQSFLLILITASLATVSSQADQPKSSANFAATNSAPQIESVAIFSKADSLRPDPAAELSFEKIPQPFDTPMEEPVVDADLTPRVAALPQPQPTKTVIQTPTPHETIVHDSYVVDGRLMPRSNYFGVDPDACCDEWDNFCNCDQCDSRCCGKRCGCRRKR